MMAAPKVEAWLSAHAPDARCITVTQRTATVAEAAVALGVAPGQIAKSLAVRLGDARVLIVASGTARLDNRKCKDEFGARPRMLGPEETLAVTGHPIAGVCPFALADDIPILFDKSLRKFDVIYPAGGTLNSSVEVRVDRLFDLVGTRWVDLCESPEETGGIER